MEKEIGEIKKNLDKRTELINETAAMIARNNKVLEEYCPSCGNVIKHDFHTSYCDLCGFQRNK